MNEEAGRHRIAILRRKYTPRAYDAREMAITDMVAGLISDTIRDVCSLSFVVFKYISALGCDQTPALEMWSFRRCLVFLKTSGEGLDRTTLSRL